MKAKETARCAYVLCPHGQVIKFGDEITWNRRSNTGERYHVDCFVAVKGLSEYAPLRREEQEREQEGKALSFKEFDSEIKVLDELTIKKEDKELKHKLYPLLFHYVGMRQHVYLWGAPGAGKSHVARQIANELGLEFSYISVNPQSPASLLLGYMDAHGIYRESELFRRWRDGGVFLFDEQDNCSSSLLTVLNGMLASDLANFPCGMVPKHQDFIFVGTGNTSGRGGDWQFPERRKIDEASIDRLAFIRWDYDNDLELALALKVNSGARQWVEWIQRVRGFVSLKANGIKGGVYATPRSSMAGAKDLLAIGMPFFSMTEIAERHVWKGTDPDTVARIAANCPLPK